MKTEQFRANIETDVKNAAESILKPYGVSLSDAFRMFVYSIVRERRFPVELVTNKPTPQTCEQHDQNVATNIKLAAQEEFDGRQETKYLLSTQANREHLAKSIEQMEAGIGKPYDKGI
jgi:addiction module RelB/DinJ family antitoxin